MGNNARVNPEPEQTSPRMCRSNTEPLGPSGPGSGNAPGESALAQGCIPEGTVADGMCPNARGSQRDGHLAVGHLSTDQKRRASQNCNNSFEQRRQIRRSITSPLNAGIVQESVGGSTGSRLAMRSMVMHSMLSSHKIGHDEHGHHQKKPGASQRHMEDKPHHTVEDCNSSSQRA